MMMLGVVLISVMMATVPIIFFLGIIWWLDRYDREPVWLVTLTFLWGGVGGIITALVISGILMIPAEMLMAPEAADSLGAVIVAPLVEEPSKALVLLLIVFSRHFDNTTDGFVYGAAAGLGFGMTENFLYFTTVGGTGDLGAFVGTIVIRTLYSAVMHACATSVIGASLGYAKFRGPLAKIFVPILGLATAMSIHALWNGLLTIDTWVGGEGVLALLNFLIFPIEALTLIVIFQACIWSEKSILRRELKGEVPDEHLPFLVSYLKRNRKSWLPAGVPHALYVETATTLAFRKFQVRRARDRAFYEDQIERLRDKIDAMLEA